MDQQDRTLALREETEEIANQIISESDIAKTKDLIDIFNWSLAKKNAIRALNNDKLLDMIDAQIMERFTKHPGEFNSKELLEYKQMTQAALDRSTKGLTDTQQEPPPKIAVTANTQVNINILDQYDRASKERVANAIRAYVAQAANPEVLFDESTIEGENSDDSGQ